MGNGAIGKASRHRVHPRLYHHFSIVDLMPEAQAFWWLPRNMLLV
jgi:hypothetical protein